jgi:hypothetical protein
VSKEFVLSLKLYNMSAAGSGRLQKDVAAILKEPLGTLESLIQSFRAQGISVVVGGSLNSTGQFALAAQPPFSAGPVKSV